MDCIVFDIDGTLSNCEHRLHHITQGRKDWDGFFDAMVDDSPNPDIVWLSEALAPPRWSHTSAFFIVTGRPDSHREQTENWLNEHAENLWMNTEALLMRASGDRREDVIIKREILKEIRDQGYNVRLVIEDRKSVVDMWREEGITCLQCAPGEF